MPPSADERWKRLPCVAALLALLVFAVSANLLAAVQMRAAAELGVSVQKLAGVFALQFGGFVLATIIGGMAADHFGKQRIFLVACAVCAVGGGLWALTPNYAGAVVGAVLLGMGGGIIESMSTALLADLFPARRRLFLNLSQVAFCVGAVGGPAVVGWLLPLGVSWRVFYAGVGLLMAGLFVLFALATIPRPAHEERLQVAVLRELGGRFRFWLPTLVIFLYVLAETAIPLYGNYYLRTFRDAPESWAIYSIALFWLAMMIGRLSCAFVPERIAYTPLLCGLLVGAGVAMAASAWLASWPLTLVAFALTGLCCSGTWPMAIALTTTLNPRYSGTVVGVTVAIGALGCVAAPPLLTGLFALLPPQYVFPTVAGSFGLAALLVLSLRPAERRAAAAEQ